MKKITLLFLAILPLLFTACSDDDAHLSLIDSQSVLLDVSVNAGDSLKILAESKGIISIDWGDGNKEEYKTSFSQNDITYVFSNAGNYQVRIMSDDNEVKHLYVNGAGLKSIPNIGFGNQIKVDSLWLASMNGLPTLDFKRLVGLEKIVLSNLSDLKRIDNINKCSVLSDLIFIDLPQLTELDFSQNKDLEFVRLDRVSLKSISLGELDRLETLILSETNLSSIDLSKLSSLTYFSCIDANLTILDLSTNPKLDHLRVKGNKLKKLDLTKNLNLEYLNCSNNLIETIALSNSEKLYNVKVNDNNLSAEILNNLFNNLPSSNLMVGYKISFANNPGSTTCDASIATKKGWLVE